MVETEEYERAATFEQGMIKAGWMPVFDDDGQIALWESCGFAVSPGVARAHWSTTNEFVTTNAGIFQQYQR